ncbi:splicing factor, arginine/serine-rich 19 [Cyprinodon tularosa]|uniref:splicing factor, arginine/serine-rich 19 n=1 Tax=Cyprinodon tularosa TaxID=77115 RepID=UPI0018E24A19|nr:splicing factor, arginine/serine-rich 19 [Cyprinodon tularosa]
MDSTSATGFRRRSSPSSSPAETSRSPPPCSPFSSPSPPSSEPSSPLSSSSSLFGNDFKGDVRALSEVARVSSTSTRPLTSPASRNAPRSPMQEEEGMGSMHYPYSPTDGEKGRRAAGEEGEKYDPFDPTGSPPSDDGLKDQEIQEQHVEINHEEPPDSTEVLTDPRSPSRSPGRSPSRSRQPPLRRRVDGSSKARGQWEAGASDHSEIEEGEIVGAADKKKPPEDPPPSNSFFGSKPERILRVLDGDAFVSVCTEGNWEDELEEEEPDVGVEDLRRKLVSRRKERYLSFPASSPLSSQPPPPLPQASPSASPVTPPAETPSKNHKASKSSRDRDRQKSKDRKPGEKVTRRKKRRKGKEEERGRSKEKSGGQRDGKEVKVRRGSRSSIRKGKKRRHSSPEGSRHSSRKETHSRRSFSSISEERHRDRDKDRDRRSHRDRDRHRNSSSSRRKDERARESSSRRRERKRESSSRERRLQKRSKSSREDRDANRDRERRREGRPVVPPSIQDLNGSDLFAIKRTITVTTTTTTTTVPGSPRLAPASPCRPNEDRKRRKWKSVADGESREGARSRSLSPLRYHGYESDRYSDKLEMDILSLDGEALDSDYPSLEETPPAPLPLEPPVQSPKVKPSPKARQGHPKKKTHTPKKAESSSTRTASNSLSSLSAAPGPAAGAPGLSSAKRVRKVGKDKVRNKSSRKDLIRSGKSKKERKGKLQSKVSVLVREGVSSTTGTSVGSGKLSMDLLGPGGAGGAAGGPVVGGSIAVVFCRDNESRSPFLKPCSEPLSLGKRSGLAARPPPPPSSLAGSAGLKAKKTKPSSITSTSSSASSPSSSLATKRRRRLAKKTGKKGGAAAPPACDGNQSKAASEGWGGATFDTPPAGGDGGKEVSPSTAQTGPPPCSSSFSSSSTSSSTSVLPPSSSPPHTPPPSSAPLRDARESSPDSQTVDSSCKTPEAAFTAEDCPHQTSPSPPSSSPSGLSAPQGAQTIKPPSEESKSAASPPCSSSSAGLTSLPHSLSSTDPSSSVSSSSAAKLLPPPPPPAVPTLPWSLQTGVDCTTGGVLALTALSSRWEDAKNEPGPGPGLNPAPSRAQRTRAQGTRTQRTRRTSRTWRVHRSRPIRPDGSVGRDIIRTRPWFCSNPPFYVSGVQILSQANQNQHHAPSSSSSSSSSTLIPPPPSAPPPPGLSPAQFILHSSLPLVGCTKTPPPHLHPSLGGGCAQTPPPMLPGGGAAEPGWENESKDSDKYLKKLHTQERAVEEVKLAIKPYYQRKDINKDEYKDILRKAVHKICHSRTGEINPVKVSNLVKLYVQRYKYFRKHGRKMDEEEREQQGALHSSA